MKSETQVNLLLNDLMENSTPSWNGVTPNKRFVGIQADTEVALIEEAPLNVPDDNTQGNEKLHIERKLEADNSITPLKHAAWKQSTVNNNEMASDTNSAGPFYDESWQSLVLDSHLESVPDIAEGQLSPESIDSAISLPSLDSAPNLDDVFEVLDEIDQFKSSMPMDASSAMQSTYVMGDLSLSHCPASYQPPIPHISGTDPYNSFHQSFDFDLVTGLQSPSRGLVTAVRRLCDLLSEPRSDHLNFVFVRLLNNTLKEMEKAVHHQSNRSRRNTGRQRNWPNKSEGDAEKISESVSTGMNRSFTFKSQSLSALPTADVMDLTGSDDWNKENIQMQQDGRAIEKGSFIALDDTLSGFMQEQFPFPRSI